MRKLNEYGSGLKPDSGKGYTGFSSNNGSDSVYFNDDGTLEVSAYSSSIDGIGELSLTEDQTEQLYNAMKAHFEK